MDSPLIRVAFGLVVGATIAAFFITQRLKDQFPLVLRFAASPTSISPNGDGVRDRTRVGFDLTQTAKISFSIVNSEGDVVRRIVTERRLSGDEKHRWDWNGRDDDGRRVPDGIYRMRVVRRDQGRVINSTRKIRVDTKPPRVELVSARPGVIAPGDPGQHPRVRIRYRGPRNVAPEFRLFRTDEGPPRVVARFRGDKTRSALWKGTIRSRPAADGDYAFTVTVRDKAGNKAVAPASVPSAPLARPATGVAVRHLTLTGPPGVVHAGAVARLDVGPYRHSFVFTLTRLGSRRSAGRGRRRGGPFRLGLPRRLRTGVYLVRVRSLGRTAVWPLAVQGHPPARGPRPLVVLPAITWDGLDPEDDDLSGFADTLENSRSLRLVRPFEQGRTPPQFTSQVAPLLRFLDQRRLAYDITTDVSLARSLGRPRGLVLAGSARWLTPDLLARLRRYVEGGGRLASLGADALKRSVRLQAGFLRAPSAPAAQDVFGERGGLTRVAPGGLAVEQDRLGLFAGLGFVGDFSVIERSAGLPAGARTLAAAGRDTGHPAFVAYRLGKGIVIRSGTPQWARGLSGGDIANVTRRIWALLARHQP